VVTIFNHKGNVGLTGAAMALALTVSSQAMAAFTAEDAAKLDADADATVAKFEADTKGGAEVLANAKRILVCPKIIKGGLGIGAEGGKCVLTSGADERLYYSSTGLKAGLIAGVESHAMILALNTDEALAKFTSGEREWEFGVDASVAVAKIGAGGDLDTTNLKKDVVSFIIGSKGLIGDLTWEGSRFKKLDVK
jgi:lipid-binding SYLF domain-containing protein